MNSRTREGFYALWTLAILLCLGVCVFVLAYTSIVSGPETAALPQEAAGQTVDVPQPGDPDFQYASGGQELMIPAAVLPETADMGPEYQNKLIFLGDSTTYGLSYYDVLPKYQVWVPSNGTLSIFNWSVETIEYYAPGDEENPQNLSIPDCAATGKPEYLIITLGINGVATLDEQQFRGYYKGLVQAIQQASPDTKIICQSIYPVVDGEAVEGITNERVNAANSWILDIATETGTRSLNTHDAIMDETGNLISSYESGDGIHMTPVGYEAILQYIRTHAYQ